MSHVTVVGNITADPELHFAGNGTAYLNFTIAENKGKDDDAKSCFYDVVAFKTVAENLSETATKGMRLIVSGRLDQDSWEADDGSKRSKTKLIADSVGPDLLWASAVVTKNERTA